MSLCKGITNKGKPCSNRGQYAGYCYAHQRKGLTSWTGHEELRDKLLKACYLYNVADKDLEAYADSVGSDKSLIGGHVLAMKRKLQTDDPTFDKIANRCGHHLRQSAVVPRKLRRRELIGISSEKPILQL